MASERISTRITVAAAGLLAAAALALCAAPASAEPGAPDPTFGSGGAVLSDLGATVTRSDAEDVQVQPDGNVVALVRDIVTSATYLLRYLPDGKLDPSFGSGGVVSLPSSLYPEALALEPDGKIVAAGTASPGYFLVLRFLPNGQLDQDFYGNGGNGNGVVTTQMSFVGSSTGHAVAVDGKGRIVVAGTVSAFGKSYFGIARYQPDGKLDPTFANGGGRFVDSASATDSVWAMTTQDDGKIVVAGVTGLGSNNTDALIARYDADGAPDGTFGSMGRKQIDIDASDVAARVAMQSGQVLVATRSNAGDRLIRFTPDGKQDPSFSSAPPDLAVNSLTVAPDGKILVGGDMNDHGSDACAIARRNPDGSPDQSFANGAPVLARAVPSTACIVEATALAPDGKIIAGELTGDYPHEHAAVARYEGDDLPTGTAPGSTGSPPQVPPSSGPVKSPLTLSRLSVTNRRFAVKRAVTPHIRHAQIARSTKRGTVFKFTLNRAATVSIRIYRLAKGRKPRVAARLKRTARARRNRVAFSGRIGRRMLRPGCYRATFTAVDATGSRSKPHSVTFRIVVR
jgi:uncharacterized delta-60 repeat protein